MQNPPTGKIDTSAMNKLYLSCSSIRGRQTSLDTRFKWYWYFSTVESTAELQTRQVAVHPCAAAAKTCPRKKNSRKPQGTKLQKKSPKQSRGWFFVGLTTWRWQGSTINTQRWCAGPWWGNSRLASPPRPQPPVHVEVHLGWTKAPSRASRVKLEIWDHWH